MKTLLVAEHFNGELTPATLCAYEAATHLGQDVDVVCFGVGLETAETLAPAIVEQAGSYTHFVAPATTFGKNLMPRVAALLDVQMVSDVMHIEGATTYLRPMYAGNALAMLEDTQEKHVLTIRPSAFDTPSGMDDPTQVMVAPIAGSRVVKTEGQKGDRPDLTDARVVVSGGRGLQEKENMRFVEALADVLGGAVGATRAVVDLGWVANDLQVGQTGKVVAPELYIAVGLSGAIQHLAGMKDSRTIVAINTDENAPIFDVATYGLVADALEAVPQLITLLNDNMPDIDAYDDDT